MPKGRGWGVGGIGWGGGGHRPPPPVYTLKWRNAKTLYKGLVMRSDMGCAVGVCSAIGLRDLTSQQGLQEAMLRGATANNAC